MRILVCENERRLGWKKMDGPGREMVPKLNLQKPLGKLGLVVAVGRGWREGVGLRTMRKRPNE